MQHQLSNIFQGKLQNLLLQAKPSLTLRYISVTCWVGNTGKLENVSLGVRCNLIFFKKKLHISSLKQVLL